MSAIETGTPIRYPSVALLCVDSTDQNRFDANKYRIDTETPSRIYINKQRPLMFGYMTRLALTEMNIQWDTPNVNSLNNTLTMAIYSATDANPNVVALIKYVRVILDNSFYTPNALASELATELNTDQDIIDNELSFTVSYDDELNAMRISQSSVYPSGRLKGYFKLVSGSAPSTLTGLPPVQYDLLYCMGMEAITKPGVEPVGYYSTIRGGYAPMLYTPYVDVVSNLLTKNQNVADGATSSSYTSSKLARIYFSNEAIINPHEALPTGAVEDEVSSICNIVGTRPCVFRREFKVPKQIQWNSTENVDLIDIQVLDYKGNPITLVEQAEYVNEANQAIIVVEKSNTVFQFTIQATEV
jgi:hypothetical protein